MDDTDAGLPRREAFDMPREVAYLNAAAYGPLSRRTRQAGEAAAAARATAWRVDKTALGRQVEQIRADAAALIGAAPGDIALVTSVSQAMATAANALSLPRGGRLLRLAGEHPSNVLPWSVLLDRGAVEEVVAEPADGDWTRAVLDAVARPGAPPLALAALSTCHWSDGALVDLDQIAPAVRAAGAALVIDATHQVGAGRIDVERLKPDFLAFPLFKWLMGPYGYACLYAAPSRQAGEPADRSAVNCVLNPELGWAGFAAGARRYDRGERDDPASIAIAATALAQVRTWGVEAVAARVGKLAAALARAGEDHGLVVRPAPLRAPHVVGMRLPGGASATEVIKQLAAGQVFVSERRGVIRVAPHLYNDMEDVERFSEALGKAL